MFGSMLTLYIGGIAVALFAALVLSAGLGLAYTGTPTLIFVANHDELYAALKAAEKGTIGSVAIAEKYYQRGTSRIQKNQIRGLMQTVFKLGDRAVYIYGQPLDVGLASELLDMEMDNCGPLYFSGKFVRVKEPNDPVKSCGVNGDALSEEIMQKELIDHDASTRRRFLE
jgi:hypothetical protein